jgi:beta-galactosidase
MGSFDYHKNEIPKQKTLFYGADYNPDQWLEYPEILEKDISLMHEAGVTSASIGIFSWSTLEPKEGQYNFTWLDAVMDRFADESLFVFLATPSGSKPFWMSEKYPEIRRVGANGIREKSGLRHNHCPSSTIYRNKVSDMNQLLAKRYKGHPALALWHIGNEFSGVCYCDLCKAEFHKWLKERYQTLENLNRQWWTGFWGHSFSAWSEIPLQDASIDALAVDFLRFMNDQHMSFIKNEIDSIKSVDASVPCTTNFMATHFNTDYWRWAELVDVVSNDLYPLHDDRDDVHKRSIASDFIHSLMRGMSGGQPWMLMECSPSSVNWSKVNKLKRPGVHRQEVMQALANGADTIHYFQWRKGRGGFEKYHGAVVDHEGSNATQIFKDCASIGNELKLLEALKGSLCPKAEVGLIYDWESRWALNASKGPTTIVDNYPFASDLYTQNCQKHYLGLTSAGLSVDLLSKKSAFDDYKVLVLPSLYILETDLEAKLNDFVQKGGILVGTFLTAYVNETNLCHLGGFPGKSMRQLFGIWNEGMDYLFPDESIKIKDVQLGSKYKLDGMSFTIIEQLNLEGAKVLSEADSDFHQGAPLITENKVKDGLAYYLGAEFDDAILENFYKCLKSKHHLEDAHEAIDLPEGVVLRKRCSNEGNFYFLFNYRNTKVQIDFGTLDWIDFSKNQKLFKETVLDPYETLILRKVC